MVRHKLAHVVKGLWPWPSLDHDEDGVGQMQLWLAWPLSKTIYKCALNTFLRKSRAYEESKRIFLDYMNREQSPKDLGAINPWYKT